ncbi:MAG: glycosyltransferase family 4 protein [Myxococcota bacterium]
MHVLLFAGRFLPDVGGMEYVVHYLAEALVDAGVEVTVLANRTKTPGGPEHRYRLIRYGLLFRGAMRSGLFRLSVSRTLSKLQREHPVDIVNFHGVARAPFWGLSFFERRSIPSVMTPHGKDVQRFPDIGYGLRLEPEWNARIEDHLQRANAVTAISESIRGELDCVAPERVHIVPNGIHRQRFTRNPSTFLHDRVGVPHDTRFVVSVGRDHIKKAYADGIHAFAPLLGDPRFDDVHYAIIGRGVSSHAMLVSELGLDGRVHLVEEVASHEVAESFNSACLFFSPSIVEGLSLVSIEAMACGLPLVVTDVPGNADVVRANGCGLLVPVRDLDAMGEAIGALLSNEHLRSELAEIAWQRSDDYDWSAIARRYLEVYASLLGEAD